MTWVVFAMCHSGGIGPFLGVADTQEEAEEISKKWWLAFDSGEKGKPNDYAGISWKPVSNFDNWKSSEEML